MPQQQPDAQDSGAREPDPRVNLEAIPSELPNAASPEPASPIRHEPQPANRGGLLLVLMMLAVLGISLIYGLSVHLR